MNSEELYLASFLRDFQDKLVPLLDPYEQTIYLYVYRHSVMEGKPDAILNISKAKVLSMSDMTCRDRLRTLVAKGYAFIVSTERRGMRVRVLTPSEMNLPEPQTAPAFDPEQADFFKEERLRSLIFSLHNQRCFYCFRELSEQNRALDHLTSQGAGGTNSFRNLVASCIACNTKKGDTEAEQYVRQIYRSGFLDESEMQSRLEGIKEVRNGNLRPDFSNNTK